MRKLKKRVILVSAAAGGKDFLRDAFVEKGYTPDVSVTSRPMRDGEEEGKTYHYVSELVFSELKDLGGFYECVSFNKWWYGTLQSNWEKADIFIMTPSGISQIPREDREDREECFIIFLDIPEDVRRGRLENRSDADSIERRIEADKKDFKDFVRNVGGVDTYISNSFFNAEEVVRTTEAIIEDGYKKY